MEFAKVTAIIRNGMIENVEMALEKAGVSAFTVAKVKGVGERERKFSVFNGPSTHFKIEIFTKGNRTEQIAGAIMDAAHTGSVGDGLVAVLQCTRSSGFETRALQNPAKFASLLADLRQPVSFAKTPQDAEPRPQQQPA